MQDRYVGDFGDLIKLSLLRTLGVGSRLGIAWWRYPDESHNSDGRYITYLSQPEKWRAFDPDLFDGLNDIVGHGGRSIAALENSGLLPGCIFHNIYIPNCGTASQLRLERPKWIEGVKDTLSDCDLLFIDPDNGLEPSTYSQGSKKAGKSVTASELLSLSTPDRALIVYHHHTRMQGGHTFEIKHWSERLYKGGFTSVIAIRSRPYSPRAFFILNASADLRTRAKAFVELWQGHLSWHEEARSISDTQTASQLDEIAFVTLQIKASVLNFYKQNSSDYLALMGEVLETHAEALKTSSGSR